MRIIERLVKCGYGVAISLGCVAVIIVGAAGGVCLLAVLAFAAIVAPVVCFVWPDAIWVRWVERGR